MAKQAALLLLLSLAGLAACSPAWGQRVRLPSGPTSWQAPGASGSPGAGGLVPIPGLSSPAVSEAPSATLGSPTFDPYSTSPGAASVAPSLPPPPTYAPGGGSVGSPYWQQPGATVPPTAPFAFPNTGYPSPAFQQQPPVLFPNGFAGSPSGFNWPQPAPGRYLRLFQDVRLKYTWLYGEDSASTMQTNDVELGTTVNFPNFFFSGRPLQVSPIFAFNFWDGPDNISETPPFPELPARVYSAYGNFRWNPMLTPQFGGDLDVNFGVFTDFDTFTTDSARLFGTGLVILNLTPTLTLKAGAAYLDRVDIKLLPAAGVFWQPNPQTRWDIYFPKPKLSQYLWTVGNTDVWWYLTGEYGGGSWTIDAPKDAGGEPIRGDRRMDINDIRVGGGLEWTHQNGLSAFFEMAYVFNRELYFASGSPTQYSLDDTVMLRGGLAY